MIICLCATKIEEEDVNCPRFSLPATLKVTLFDWLRHGDRYIPSQAGVEPVECNSKNGLITEYGK